MLDNGNLQHHGCKYGQKEAIGCSFAASCFWIRFLSGFATSFAATIAATEEQTDDGHKNGKQQPNDNTGCKPPKYRHHLKIERETYY